MSVMAASSLDDIALRIEENPLDPDRWRELVEAIPAEDVEDIRSLNVIMAGLRELKQAGEQARARNERPPAPSPLAAPLFSQLAHHWSEPRLLKEAGMIYLSTWRLPVVAQKHFERCLRLGEPERDVRPLIEAAATAAQRQTAAQAGQKPAPTLAPAVPTMAQQLRQGTQQASPKVAEMMRRAGMQEVGRSHSKRLAAPITQLRKEEVHEATLPRTGLECVREATAMIAQGRLDRARALLLRAGDNPRQGRETAQAWASLGKAHYEAGEYPAMEMAYQEASKSEPETMVAHFNLALAKQLNGKFDQAEALYLMADKIQPNHPKIWCNLGSLYLLIGRHADAEKALRNALKADPGYARAWDNLAAALELQGKMDEALEACRHAIEVRPGYPAAYFKMGVIFFGRSRPAEASEAFRQATESSALAPSALAFLGTIHARLGQLGPAADVLQRATDLEAPVDLLWTAWNELGKAHYALRRYHDAADVFEKATQVRETEAEGWFNLGLALHMAGNRMKAQEAYRCTLDIDARFPLAWHNLGLVCTEMKLHEEAAAAFEAELKLQPENALAWYELGVNLEAEGRAIEAQQAYLKAEELENPPTSTASAA
jgi:tetratricopeptide (TPR) repeat protein